jgi:integrase
MEDGEILCQSGKPFLQSSRAKNYKTIQKFLRWMGQEEFCDNWDTREDSRTKQIVTRKEVEQMAEASTPAISCFLWMLFDGGFRAEEFANLRWMDLKKKDGKGYYQAQVRAETSKTKKGRVVSLWLATDAIDRLRRELERSGNFEPSQFLYAGKYHSLLKAVKRLGRRVLERDISPHVLRHSSASYYANIIKTYQNFCFRYGWSLKSGIAQRYWHPTTDDEIADQAQEHEIGRFRNDFERMKIERGALSEEVQRLRHELEQFKSAVFDHFIRSGEADRLHELITQHDSAESVPPAEPTLRTEAISGRQSP